MARPTARRRAKRSSRCCATSSNSTSDYRPLTMRFASLGSGSEGNALVVEVGDTRVLIDCGFRVRDTVARLMKLGLVPESISAILVTHEHADHIGGVAAFATRFRIPVWLTFGTLAMVDERFSRMERVYGFDS